MSTLKADTIQSTSGGAATLTKQHAAKVWVDYTTVSSTAISKSFNVSSLTDNGTGDTTITITNNMDSVDYSPSAISSYTYAAIMLSDNGKAAGSVDVETRNLSDTLGDSNDNSVVIHGELA
tara:strand:- start:1068 stop:1430 length:363 start_codon:yes stop_codon:yes gene_type:complete